MTMPFTPGATPDQHDAIPSGQPGRAAPHSGQAVEGADYVPPDPTLIEPSPASLVFWSHTLGVSREALARATASVGPDLQRVKTELGVGGVG